MSDTEDIRQDRLERFEWKEGEVVDRGVVEDRSLDDQEEGPADNDEPAAQEEE